MVTVREPILLWEVIFMCGYFTSKGFYGKIGNRYYLFATEQDYYEFLSGDEE